MTAKRRLQDLRFIFAQRKYVQHKSKTASGKMLERNWKKNYLSLETLKASNPIHLIFFLKSNPSH